MAPKVLWTSKNGKWKILLINHYIRVDGDLSDYPIKYNDGSIVYDRPERIPQYVKNKVKSIFKSFK